MRNVINMCRSGGFNLTKFISNMKKFMISIPEDKKRPDVNDLTLLVSVPVEKALSIQWKDY